jgi:hypothetical protein
MRAITEDDYAAIARREFEQRLQRAAARLTANPNGRATVTVLIDPLGAEADDASLRADVKQRLERFRRIGHDLEVTLAEYAPLELTLKASLLPHYQRGAVRAALLDRFSNRELPDGSRGFFHPDALTFGQGIAVSAIVAAAQGIPGVAYVTVTRLRRQGSGGDVPDDGLLNFSPHQIARLDNDPDFPEHGVLKLELEGGR